MEATSTNELPAVGGLAPWYGAKRTLGPVIVEEIGPHRAYWEPFCGSMAVLMAKPAVGCETVNDLHGDLINLARVVQDPKLGAMLYRRLRRTFFSKDQQQDSRSRIVAAGPPSAPDLERAYDYFLTSWTSMNGVSGTTNHQLHFARRFSSKGGSGGTRLAAAVDSIPSWRRRMRKVAILNDDAFGLVERIEDEPGTVIYLDPPYLTKGAKYLHDLKDEDHQRLADLVARFRHTRVIVSYYDDPRLDSLYPGWTKRQIVVSKALVSQGRRNKDNPVKAVEVLLINGPSFATSRRSLFDEVAE